MMNLKLKQSVKKKKMVYEQGNMLTAQADHIFPSSSYNLFNNVNNNIVILKEMTNG